MLLRYNGKRRKNAILLIWLVLIFNIISVGFEILEVGYFDYIDEGQYGFLESFFYLVSAFFNFGYFIVNIISTVTFIMWFRRAYYNLHQKIHHLSYSEGWAVGAWFVPIMNWFAPYKIMKELYQKTSYFLIAKDSQTKYSLDTSNLNNWWALWIIVAILEGISFRLFIRDYEIYSAMVSLVACVLTIPLAMITVKILKDYGVAEDKFVEIANQELSSDREMGDDFLNTDS